MNWINLILSDIITVIGLYFVFKRLNDNKLQLKTSIIFTIIMFIVFFIDAAFFNIFTKNILNLIMIIFVSYLTILDKNLMKSIYYGLIFIFMNCIIEIILSMILMTIFKFSKDIYQTIPYSMIIFTILIIGFTYLSIRVKFIYKLLKKCEEKLLKSDVIKYYVIVFTILIILLAVNNFTNYEKNIEYYINFGMLIFIIMVSIIILYNKITKDKIEKQYKEMMEYVSKYEQIINEQGKKNHEFNNQLMVLNGYIGNEEKLREYLVSIIDDHKGGKNYTIEQLSYFPDGGIKGLIYHKLSKMEEYEIRPYLYISNEVKDIFETKFDVSTYSDITKLFGVFLDNAIEAAKDADKKEIEIDMKKDGEYLIVTIGNTYSKDVDVEKIGKKGFTTKGTGHGFGLSLVKDIIKKNSKIESFNDVTNDTFKQTIMIDLK